MKTLKDLILAEHSKAQALLIADIICQKPELLDDLLLYTFANEEPLSRRASWPLRILIDQNPELLNNHLEDIISQLVKISSIAVLRNILAILSRSEIPEKETAFLLNFSTDAILNPKSSVAVICHATDLFLKISNNEMVLLRELLLMLETISPNPQGGLNVKRQQVISAIRKQEKNQD